MVLRVDTTCRGDADDVLDTIETSLLPKQQTGSRGRKKRGAIFRRSQLHQEIQVQYESRSVIPDPSSPLRRRVLSDGCLQSAVRDECRLSLDEHDQQQQEFPYSPLGSIMSVSNWIPRPAPDDCIMQIPLQIPVLSSDYDDEKSISFFQPDDFDSAAWQQVVSRASAYGLVVAALATAVTHPILFCVAAVAVVGGASAYRSEDDIRNWLGWDPKAPVTTSAEPDIDDSGGVSPPSLVETSAHSSFSAPDDSLMIEADTSCSATLDRENVINFYPTMEHTVVADSKPFVGLNAAEIFNVFFDDEAPYNFRLLQEQRGDIDINYGTWQPLQTEGPISFMSSAPGHHHLPLDSFVSYQTRTLVFKAKTNNIFGPPYATTTKVQRFMIASKKLAILESKTELADIPFCDRFFLIERWIITASKRKGRYDSRLQQASCEIFFTGSCPFESQIRSKSVSTIKDVANAWCEMATEALRLAEEAKKDRISKGLA